MSRTSTLLTAMLVGAALLQPTTATAQAPPCQGKAVTIDGRGATQVIGTEGDDVIVSDTASEVIALGGNDLVCLAAGHANPVVRAGAGDDVVDATAATGTNTFLGEGDDTYLGSRYRDVVAAGDGETDDRGRDVVDTGPRSELQDVVYSGEPGRPNDDQLRAGYVELWWSGSSTGTATLDGGVASTLHLRPEVSRLWVWASIDVMFVEGQPNQELSGFTDFAIAATDDLERLVFGGGPADEHVTVDGPSSRTKLDIDLGRGDDELELTYYGTSHPRTSLSGGRGTDRLALGVHGPSDVSVDLGRGRLTLGRGSRPVAARGFEDASVLAQRVDVVGTSGPNTIEVGPCRGTVEGRGGSDTLSAYVDTPRGSRVGCRGARGVLLAGGAGADRLFGAGGADLLVGGPGRDRADGGRGRDTCSAEVVTSCEARR
ncbi:hypothetical protein L2K70_10115 [Nocardioides KLBMP 9356]|uniref:Calcium-binding protein n=1 Tax=Nocardioides potassii TaxID=2911371 RepID=A0ABS9HCX3_9ACTN|nr:hypothetical protein [Nocardioides potassii]MCF6377961.1 hypothetical protein [Nocardioides potassii]